LKIKKLLIPVFLILIFGCSENKIDTVYNANQRNINLNYIIINPQYQDFPPIQETWIHKIDSSIIYDILFIKQASNDTIKFTMPFREIEREPFELENGHYQIEIFNHSEPLTDKMSFWVPPRSWFEDCNYCIPKEIMTDEINVTDDTRHIVINVSTNNSLLIFDIPDQAESPWIEGHGFYNGPEDQKEENRTGNIQFYKNSEGLYYIYVKPMFYSHYAFYINYNNKIIGLDGWGVTNPRQNGIFLFSAEEREYSVAKLNELFWSFGIIKINK